MMLVSVRTCAIIVMAAYFMLIKKRTRHFHEHMDGAQYRRRQAKGASL